MAKKLQSKNFTPIDLHISELIKLFKQGKDFNSYIKAYKFENSYGNIIQFYKKLPKKFKDVMDLHLFPKNIKNINNGVFGFYDTNTEANLNEMLALFNIHHETINHFLEEKKEFEKKFILGQYDELDTKLERIANNIAFSNWHMYHSFLVKEHLYGFEGNISLLKMFLENGSNHPLHDIFCLCFSRLVEQDLTINNYETHLEYDIYRTYNLSNQKIKQFIQAYIDPFSIYSFEDINGVFVGEDGNSLVDRYLIFRKLLINLTINNKTLGLKIILKVLKFIKDPQLYKIYFFMTADLSFYENTEENSDFYKILDFYTEGKYEDCIDLSGQYLLTQNISIDILEVYLKSHINMGKELLLLNKDDSILDKILKNMFNVLNKNSLTLESLNNLHTIAYSLHHFDISTQLLYFIHKTKNTQSNVLYNKIYQIYAPVITPKVVYEFHDFQTRQNILNILLTQNDNTKTISFFIKLLDYEMSDAKDLIALNVPKNRLLLHISKILFEKKDYVSVIKNIEPIYNDFKNIPHIYEECLVRLYGAFSMSKEIPKCINLYVDNYFYNKYLLDNIDTKMEISSISDLGYKKLTINLDLILYLHICKANAKILSLVYRMFMRTLHLNYPSEIKSDDFENAKIIYFLRYICIQDILSKDVINFKTPNDVEAERLKICQSLLGLDKEKSSIYNDEIIAITQNIKIKERIREIDNSKIYVDVNSLINYDLKDFEKSFSRFKKINDLRKKSSDEYSMLVHTESNIDLESSHEYKKKYLTLLDQLKNIFVELFIEIRDQYLFSNEHGLDSYLSTRIRHGTITGQLRKTFSDFSLITTKDSETDVYLDNLYWIKKLNLAENSIAEFNNIMNNFSNDIDTYNVYIKNFLIQIKTEQKSEALFNFSTYDYFNSHVINHYFTNYIVKVETYEAFIMYSIQNFETILDHNLELIRRYFDETIKKKFLDLLDNLEKNILSINSGSKYSLLLKNIRHARTDIQTNIDLVSSWFERKKRKNIDFEFKDVIDTSKKIIDNLVSSSITLNIQSEIDCSYSFEGKNFINFVDLFKIFFENIVNYIKSKNHIQADIGITLLDCDDYFIYRISNELIDPSEEELDVIDKKIEEKALDIKKPINGMANRMEDNTGILKATKIIKRAFGNMNNDLIFKRENTTITIELKIHKKGIINENSDC